MSNPTMKTGEIIELLQDAVGQQMGEDVFYIWFEELYRLIREQKWAWNWRREGHVTYAPIADPTNTYSWVAGNNFVTGSTAAVAGFDWNNTGRYWIEDNRIYKAIEISAFGAAARITFDKPIHTASTVGAPLANLTLVRADHVYKTSSIKNVNVNGLKKPSSTDDDFDREFNYTNRFADSGLPLVYRCDDNSTLPRTQEAPEFVSAAGGAFTGGEYQYFWAAYDKESGQYGPPGPTFTYTATAGQRPTFRYGATNLVVGNSYPVRLFRSQVDPSRARVPMYFIGEKDPTSGASNVADAFLDPALRNNEKWYEGPTTKIDFRPPPDAVYPLEVNFLDNWGQRPELNEYVNLGRNNEVLELLRFGFHKFAEMQNKDPQSFRLAVVQFRQQMAYLLRGSRSASAEDPGIGESRDYRRTVNTGAGYDDLDFWFHWRS